MLDKKWIFLFYYSTLLVSIFGVETKSNSNYITFPAKENGTCYKRVPYDDAIAANISRGIVKTLPGSQYAGVKTASNRAWVTIIDCCEGFTRNITTGKCETHCDEGCFRGTCTGPNICTCEDGFAAESGICKPVCRRQCPENAYCFAPDFCTCKFGYEEIDGACRPVCRHDCKNGDCVAPRVCQCHSGYFLNETQHCEAVCEGGCPHGDCVSPGVCACNSGYKNPPNDRESCVPYCPESCKNGECLAPGLCTCKVGYSFSSNGSCVPQCQNGCVNGDCIAPDQCACKNGFIMNPQSNRCESSFNYVTTPPEVLYENLNNPRPQGSSQVQGANNTFKGQQFNQTYGSVAKAIGTQGIVQNRNGATDEQQDLYEINGRYENHGSNRAQNPQSAIGVKGGNRNSPYGSYGNSQPYNPQGSSSAPRPSHTQNPQGVNDSYRANGNNQTRRPQGPFADQEPRQNPNQTPNPQSYDDYGTTPRYRIEGSYNPYVTFPTQQLDNTQGQTTPRYRIDGSYNPYVTFPTLRPDNTQGQTSTPNPRNINNSYGFYVPNQTQNPEVVRPQVANKVLDKDDISGYHGIYPDIQTYRPEGPLPEQRLFTPIGNGPTSGSRPNSGYYETQGIKNPHRQPGSDQFDRRPVVNPNPAYPGVDLTYGLNEMYIIPDGPFIYQGIPQGPGQVQGLPQGAVLIHGVPQNPYYIGTDNTPSLGPSLNHKTPEPYNPHNSAGNYDNGKDNGPASGHTPNPSGSLCDVPCLNGECVGRNQCACKRGYDRDPRDPYGNACIPVCQGGCLNGVCSAPNFCICNLGFVKEHGVKGVQRCVSAN